MVMSYPQLVRFKKCTLSLTDTFPFHELAWSGLRYDAYCFVMPEPASAR